MGSPEPILVRWVLGELATDVLTGIKPIAIWIECFSVPLFALFPVCGGECWFVSRERIMLRKLSAFRPNSRLREIGIRLLRFRF